MPTNEINTLEAGAGGSIKTTAPENGPACIRYLGCSTFIGRAAPANLATASCMYSGW